MAYRYIALFATSVQGGSGTGAMGFQYIEIAAVDGVNLATNPALAFTTSSAHYQTPGDAIATGQGNWQTGDVNGFWAYDLGAGNTVNPQRVKLTADGFTPCYPMTFDMRGSNDAANWTTLWSGTHSGSVGGGQVIKYSDPSIPPPVGRAPHRYWAVFATSVQGGSGAGAMGFEYIEFAGADGVNLATLPAGAFTISSAHLNDPTYAIDGQPGNWQTGDVNGMWGYDFGVGNTAQPSQVKITADSFVAGYPMSFDFRGSDDGGDWATAWSASQASPIASGQVTVYSDPQNPVTAVRRSTMMVAT